MQSSNLIIYILGFIFGSIIGSFLNVCIFRIPEGKSLVFPPSHCRNCKNPVRFYHNIPLLSYIFLKGRCSFCGVKISPIYPLVELVSGLITVLMLFLYGPGIKTFSYLLIAYTLIVVTVIDIKHFIIPNVITLPGIIIGIAVNALRTDWNALGTEIQTLTFSHIPYFIYRYPIFDSIGGAITGGGVLLLIALVYQYLRKTEGMGMGDVKLLAMLGAFLGIKSVVFIIFVSSLIGSVVGISLMLYKKGNLQYAIPYGPFLSLAALVYMLLDGLTSFYR